MRHLNLISRLLLVWALGFLASGCNKYRLAHHILGTPNPKAVAIRFDTANRLPAYAFNFPDTQQHSYLRTLRTDYRLTTLTGGDPSATVLQVMNWTHRQWEHNGSVEPSRPDALTILKEAKEGRNFRCVEYATVLTDALLSLGYKARTVALKSRDAATCKMGAGHVLSEVFMPQYGKWALMDAQFNIMPLKSGIPLNAVELQAALATKEHVELVNANGPVTAKERRRYTRFITPYLYFFETAFSHRSSGKVGEQYNGKTHLMLVPLGAQNPSLFQRRFPIDYCVYTNSLQDFYPRPDRTEPLARQ